jgi:hypothetical protein
MIPNWLISIFEGGKTLTDLKKWVGIIDSVSLDEWKNKVPDGFSYISFSIPKKHGGYRDINAPNDKLKKLQTRIYWCILKHLKPHSSCCGFMPGKSIVDAARPHVSKAVVLNLDLKDFFPSTKESRVHSYFRHIGWGRTAAKVLSRICCDQGALPIGAPTSPALSNLVNFKLDSRLSGLAKRYHADYTRYADDITFSFTKFENRHKRIIKYIQGILNSEGYQIQYKKKIRIQRAHQRQTVVGLVVNKKVNLPRTLRRKIRAIEHQATLSPAVINGYRSFLNMVK